MNEGTATSGSGDQGIDAYGWSTLFAVNEAFAESDNSERLVGDAKVFAFASAKKTEAAAGDIKLISPAVIREVIGGWIIQRSASSAWTELGVKFCSPVQMIFATTYRLSTDSRSLCNELGIEVWGLPELVFLVAKNAPNAVFDTTNQSTFIGREFGEWWRDYDRNRQRVPSR